MSNEINSESARAQPPVYQIRIKGHLGREWTNWFEGLAITLEDNGDTLITGPVVDQAALHGLLRKRNLDMVRSIGADHVIDYTQEDFIKNGQCYDLIVATAGYRSIFDYKRALSPRGMYVATGGSMAQIFQGLLIGPWISMTGRKRMGNLLVKPNKDPAFMKELIVRVGG
jgi:Zinc-binding dehydrogenase